MDLRRVSAEEAKRLVEAEGYTLLDVRSMPEFDESHSEGAYNVPFLHKTPQGMIPNPEFARIVQHAFPDPQSKLVTYCQMGGRSVRAAVELQNLGYHGVVDMRGGFGGERDESGAVVNPGWRDAGLPVETGESEARSYKSLNNAANQDKRAAAAPEAPAASGHSHGHDHGHGHSHDAPAAAPVPAPEEGMNRFASNKRRVVCAKLGRELPGLKRRPYPGPLGERIFAEISAEAWNLWVEHSKMIINEYRIHSADPKAVKLLMEQCESFLYGEGAARPEGFVPQSH